MKSVLNNLSLKGGLYAAGIAAGISVVFLIFGFYARIHSVRFIDLMISLASIVLFVSRSIRSFKKANGGFLTISQSVKMGSQIAFIAAIGLILYNFIFINVLKPDYYDNIYYGTFSESTRAHFEEFSRRETWQESYDSYAAGARNREYTRNYPMLLVLSLTVGLLVSLFAGLIMKKKPVIIQQHEDQ